MARDFEIHEHAPGVPVDFAYAWYSHFHEDDLHLMGVAGTRRVEAPAPDRRVVRSRLPWWLGGMRVVYQVTLRPQDHAYDARVTCALFRGEAAYEFRSDGAGGTVVHPRWRLHGGPGRWIGPAFVARAALRYTTRHLVRAMAHEHAAAADCETSAALPVAAQE